MVGETGSLTPIEFDERVSAETEHLFRKLLVLHPIQARLENQKEIRFEDLLLAASVVSSSSIPSLALPAQWVAGASSVGGGQ
jgi:hypothetical protein